MPQGMSVPLQSRLGQDEIGRGYGGILGCQVERGWACGREASLGREGGGRIQHLCHILTCGLAQSVRVSWNCPSDYTGEALSSSFEAGRARSKRKISPYPEVASLPPILPGIQHKHTVLPVPASYKIGVPIYFYSFHYTFSLYFSYPYTGCFMTYISIMIRFCLAELLIIQIF